MKWFAVLIIVAALLSPAASARAEPMDGTEGEYVGRMTQVVLLILKPTIEVLEKAKDGEDVDIDSAVMLTSAFTVAQFAYADFATKEPPARFADVHFQFIEAIEPMAFAAQECRTALWTLTSWGVDCLDTVMETIDLLGPVRESLTAAIEA